MSRQLDLAAERVHRVTLADGRSVEAPYVEPVRVEVAGRTCFAGAMVFGDQVLLGAIPIEDLDLLVGPEGRSWCRTGRCRWPRDLPRSDESVQRELAEEALPERVSAVFSECRQARSTFPSASRRVVSTSRLPDYLWISRGRSRARPSAPAGASMPSRRASVGARSVTSMRSSMRAAPIRPGP